MAGVDWEAASKSYGHLCYRATLIGQWSTRGQFACNCHMVTKFSHKNTWPEHYTLSESKVMQGHPGSTEVNFTRSTKMVYHIWSEDLQTRVKCIAGVKGHARVISCQPEVNFLKFGQKDFQLKLVGIFWRKTNKEPRTKNGWSKCKTLLMPKHKVSHVLIL